jgi:HD-like signal output (HDOD) protein
MKKTVVFVDDEPEILAGLKLLLRREKSDYDLFFFETADEVLEFMSQHSADVLVSDLRMPGMNGCALLQRAKEDHPELARVLFSAAGRDEAMRIAPYAHQFLPKPCEPHVFRAVVQRACAIQDALRSPATRAALGGISTLPSPPQTYIELARELDSEEMNLVAVSRIVERDPAVSAKVLQLATSAFFCPPRPLRRIADAVQRLGTTTIRALVAGIDTFGRFGRKCQVPELSPERLQDNAVRTSLVCRAIAPPALREEAMLAGILHDIGLLALASTRPDAVGHCLRIAHERGLQPHRAERETFGFTQSAAGGYLLGLWGLPNTIVEAVLGHQEPHLLHGHTLDAATVVHVATGLVAAADHGLDPHETIDVGHLRRLGVDDQLPDWMIAVGLQAADGTTGR